MLCLKLNRLISSTKIFRWELIFGKLSSFAFDIFEWQSYRAKIRPSSWTEMKRPGCWRVLLSISTVTRMIQCNIDRQVDRADHFCTRVTVSVNQIEFFCTLKWLARMKPIKGYGKRNKRSLWKKKKKKKRKENTVQNGKKEITLCTLTRNRVKDFSI